ncbi:glycosyltransferase [Bifidobacterium ramosum]|uniref:Glycosyltransferase n=2 Tax=Bifidobacterium ramosum TaxID=1798158 RepID=A0A6L4X0W1_9BIFI|nr:glycosyltransferase [Bifidobacterium ramosum]NEG71810.1 hypothetical protein [Bifidobacterium ramosum]
MTRLRRIVPFAIAVAAIVIMEVFVFNLPFWQTRNLTPETAVEEELGSGLTVQNDGTLLVTDPNEAWRVVSSSEPIRYLYVNPSDSEQWILQYGDDIPEDERQPLSVVWQYSTKKATDGDWYAASALQGYSPAAPSSRYSRVDNGAVKVRIRYVTFVNARIPHTTITANPNIPMRFSKLRLGIEILVALIILAFRPGSSLYRRKMELRRVVCWAPIAVLTVIEAAFALGLVFVTSAPERVNPEYWSGIGSFWAIDQYQRLADALVHGRVNLDYAVNPALAAMSNPYDAGGRFQLAFANPDVPVYFDVAFKDGQYYSYFGVVPVLLLYVPYLLVTGHALLTSRAIMVFVVLTTVSSTILAVQLARLVTRRGSAVSLGAVMLGSVCMFLGNVIAIVVPYGLFYPIPQVCAVMFGMLGLSCWIEAKIRGLSKVWIAFGSLCMALTIGCRPQVVLASLLALPLFWNDIVTLWQEGWRSLRAFGREAAVWLCAAVPYALVIAGQFAYNAARFGKITDFGSNYNLTGYDMTHNEVGISRYISFFFYYFFQPPNLSGRFPFVNEVLWPTVTFRSYHYNVGSYFLAIAPFALIVFTVFAWRAAMRRIQVMGLYVASGIAVFMMFIVNSRANGVDFRYTIDFGWLIVVAMLLIVYVADATTRDVGDDAADELSNVGSSGGASGIVASSLRRILHTNVFGFLTLGIVLSLLMTVFKQCMASATNLVPTMNMDVDRWWDMASWFIFLQ